ncbi:hypothetical protein WJX81_005166 [Elliptochloris bilobata]|uniref:Ubiquitin-like domain-containing protein n=1 Tax=Elliptochloris bilobata TaxID=381761 RepID=A0AAW1QJT1_9CHLO
MGDNAEETKPEVGNLEHVNIKVKSQDGAVVCFKAKRTTQFRKLMKAYCERQGHPIDQVAFLFEGNRVREEMTPAELDMDTGEL